MIIMLTQSSQRIVQKIKVKFNYISLLDKLGLRRKETVNFAERYLFFLLIYQHRSSKILHIIQICCSRRCYVFNSILYNSNGGFVERRTWSCFNNRNRILQYSRMASFRIWKYWLLSMCSIRCFQEQKLLAKPK